MDDNTLVHARQGLLKYILYHYRIENKETVWLLNYLKDHDSISKFRIMVPDESVTEGLTVTKNFTLIFHYKGLFISEADVIINLLSQLTGSYYIYFTFDDDKVRHLTQLEYIYKMIQTKEIPDVIELTDNEKRQLRRYVTEQIEFALMLQDRKDFNFYSTLLKQLKDG